MIGKLIDPGIVEEDKKLYRAKYLGKKIIWIINQYAGSKYHGMGYRSYYFAKEFIRHGYNVFIFSSSYYHGLINPPDTKGIISFEKIDKINYFWIKVPKYKKSKSIVRALSMIVFMIRLFKVKVKNIDPPDKIIVSSPSPFPILNGYIWSKKYNAKLIFEVRDLWPLSLIELGSISKYNPFALLIQRIESFAYKRSDYVISVLPKADSYMIKHGVNVNKYIHIPNGIDIKDLHNVEPLEDEIIRKIPKGRLVIGYTGALGIANALEYLIKAAYILKKYTDIFFVIVGNGGEKEKLVNMSCRLNNIMFIEAVRKAQVQNILKYFDVCYISLKKEKLFQFGVSPNKLFDYMYAGKSILYAISSGNDPVKEANCGISVEAEDTNAIAETLLKFYRMTEKERNQLGKNGRDYVIKNHSYESLVKKYIELFE